MKLTYSRAMLDSPHVWVEGSTPREFEQESAMRHQYRCDDCGVSIFQVPSLYLNAPARDPPEDAPSEAVLGFYAATTSLYCDKCRTGATGREIQEPREYQDFTAHAAIVDAHEAWTLEWRPTGQPLPINDIHGRHTKDDLKSIRSSVPSDLYVGSGIGPDAGIAGTVRGWIRGVKRRLEERKVPDGLTTNPVVGAGPNIGDPRVPVHEDYNAEDTPAAGRHLDVDPIEALDRLEEEKNAEESHTGTPSVEDEFIPEENTEQYVETDPIQLEEDEDPFEDSNPRTIPIE